MGKVTNCRICQSASLHFFLDLGATPLANSFVLPKNAARAEEKFPLQVCLCRDCGLVQLGFVVPPEKMFSDYIYFSSTSATIRKHFAALAAVVVESFAAPGELVVEAASNDGVLLKNMLGGKVRILGVEPASNVAKVAVESGVETLNDFFNSKTAQGILKDRGHAAVFIANNVLAHVPDLADFVQGIGLLLSKDGVAIMEFPYAVDMYQRLEFDTVYHEHLSYFTLKPLARLFAKQGMEIFDAEKFEVHGGTIRIYVQKIGGKRSPNRKRLDSFAALEERLGLYSPEAWDGFASKVVGLKSELLTLLKKLKKAGHAIAIYSAPAKGNTLLNYCGIGSTLVDYAVDKSPYKQGMLMPGSRLMVFPPEKLGQQKPDYILILAWNFADEIIGELGWFKSQGGHFILPIPWPKII